MHHCALTAHASTSLLRGREPLGCVAPGREAADLLAQLRRELMALRDPATGQAIIARVFTPAEHFGEHHHPDLPDLLCVFRTDVGIIERCESPSVGRVHVSVYHPHAPRSGDHTVNSRLWMSGPGIAAATAPDQANVLDIGPTVLSLLDVPVPQWMDGVPLMPELATAPATTGERVVRLEA